MIYACTIWGRWRSLEVEVPFKKIGVERGGVVCWVGVGLKFCSFSEDAFYGRGFSVECGQRHSE